MTAYANVYVELSFVNAFQVAPVNRTLSLPQTILRAFSRIFVINESARIRCPFEPQRTNRFVGSRFLFLFFFFPSFQGKEGFFKFPINVVHLDFSND